MKSIDWIHVGQDSDQWLAPVDMGVYFLSFSNRLNIAPIVVAVSSKALG